MKKFSYDLNKYLSYRKATRNEETKDKLEVAIEELKHKEINLKGNNECKLSENAKKMVHDIERVIDNGH